MFFLESREYKLKNGVPKHHIRLFSKGAKGSRIQGGKMQEVFLICLEKHFPRLDPPFIELFLVDKRNALYFYRNEISIIFVTFVAFISLQKNLSPSTRYNIGGK
jgi:hypothetical protein